MPATLFVLLSVCRISVCHFLIGLTTGYETIPHSFSTGYVQFQIDLLLKKNGISYLDLLKAVGLLGCHIQE